MSETAEKRRSVTLICEKHGEYITSIRNYPGLGEKEEDPACPACGKEIQDLRQREQEEQEKQRVIRKLMSMNIEERFFKATLDNFDAYNDELLKHLKTCRDFAAHPDGKLVMIGENGNGKTHLAIGVLRKLGGVIYTAFEIGANLRRSYNGDTREHKVFEELCTVPLLVIDEVEKIKDSESKQNWMSHVIGKRYNRMLPIILIANCHAQKNCKEQIKPCPRCLEYHLENDVLSRIIEDGIIMEFNSPDYRVKIRDARFGGGK